MTLEELGKKLQVLEDIEAIKKLKARYAQACDDNYNPEVLEKMFTEDAVWDGGEGFGVHRGRKAIKEFFAGVSKSLTFAIHYAIAPDITVEGDKAYGKWYLFMTGTQDGTKAFWAGGFYEDEYAKVGGKWLFSRVKANILFLTPYEEGWVKKPFMD